MNMGVGIAILAPHPSLVEIDGDFVAMIPRNSTIPTKKKEYFTTTTDNQTTVVFDVFG